MDYTDALRRFEAQLIDEEKSSVAIQKYKRDVCNFCRFASGRTVDKARLFDPVLLCQSAPSEETLAEYHPAASPETESKSEPAPPSTEFDAGSKPVADAVVETAGSDR